jgi:hypothetical protein
VAKRDGDGQGTWPEPGGDTIEIPDDLRKEVVGIQLLDGGLQQLAGPR